MKKEYDKAVGDYEKAIRLKPDNPRFYFDRGLVWYARNDYNQAIADTTAIRLKPDNPVTYFNRALAWSARHEYDSAIADYTTAIRLKPHNPAAYHGRGHGLE